MSDVDVVDKFVGNYEQRDLGRIKNEDPRKRTYYPNVGVKFRIDKVLLTDVPGGAYARVTITDDEGAFSAKLALERAAFRVDGDTLVATNLIIDPGLLLTETLTMMANGKGGMEMKHSLLFSDNKHGEWICEP